MISVVIPSYNSSRTISACLDSVKRQTITHEVEVILVDSSDDGTAEIVASQHPDVRLVRLTRKTDPGTARNIGIGLARGDLIAFIDADCIAASDWLERIAAAHESSYDIAGGIIRNSPDSDNIVGRAGYMAEFRDFLPVTGRREVTHIPTCNIAYKKRIFERFGLFQGKYYPQEDLFFNHVLYGAGKRILLDPHIQIWHRHRTRLGDFFHHQYKIGQATSKVLGKIPLRGSWIARSRFLSICLAPLMVLTKFTRTVQVFSKDQPGFVKERPMVLPVLALGLMSWGIGFISCSGNERTAPGENT